jgi:GT2 family glycosyltransferase
MEKLIVVIVSWNTVKLTRDCLVSLYTELDRLEIENEVWVVDNASTDDSVAMVKQEYPQVKLIENNDNVGFAQANNQILRQADGDYYLLLNTDTIVHEAAIEMMLRYFRAHADIGAVGPRLIYPGGAVQQSITRLPSIASELRYCLAFHFFPFSGLFHSASLLSLLGSLPLGVQVWPR